MKISAIDRMRTLPVHRDEEVWEVGLVEVKPPADMGAAAAPMAVMACVSKTRDGAAMLKAESPADPDDELALRTIAQCALEPHVPGVRPWNYLPSRINVGVLPPGMKHRLDEFFGPLNITVEVKPRLEAIDMLTEMFSVMSGDGGPEGLCDEPPALMSVPGMTANRARSFALAGRAFYMGKPWRVTEGIDEVWEVRPAPPWPELSHCHVMGHLGEVYGLAFFRSIEQADEFVRLGEEHGPDEMWNHLSGTHWMVSMDSMSDAPAADALLWKRESLPTCGKKKRLPVAIGVVKPDTFVRPSPEMLSFIEGVMLAMATVTPADAESGSFERTVQTGEGPRTLSLVARQPAEGSSGMDPLDNFARALGLLPGGPDMEALSKLLEGGDVLGRLKGLMSGGSKGKGRARSKARRNSGPRPVKAAKVYTIKATLKGSKPPIWRRLLVRDDATLANLHDALQIAFGWTESHLHQFEVNDERYSRPPAGMPVDAIWDSDDAIDSQGVRLADLGLAPKSQFRYVYDFGDNWEVTLGIEKELTATEAEDAITRLQGSPWKEFKANTRTPCVACVAGARRGPPEDCGGVWGYAELCEIMADPKHPEHEERSEWLSDFDEAGEAAEFDPERFDLAAINRSLSSLVKGK